MASYSSVLGFVDKATKLQRVDALIANASIATLKYAVVEDNEFTLTISVISTFFLVLAMLPKMKETADQFRVIPVISVTTPGQHTSASSWRDSPRKARF
jgi:NAD(P)-dependent dehydrogenase (short-subunit alcohol dehydrogenase family)